MFTPYPPQPRRLAFGRAVGAAPANNSSNVTWVDIGITTLAVPAQPEECWLRLFLAGILSGSTNAAQLQVVTNDANLTPWIDQTATGAAFATWPYNLSKPIPAGTAIPALKARYRSTVNAQAVAIGGTSVSVAPENLAVWGHLLVERLK